MFKIFNITKNTSIASDKPYMSNGLSSQGFVYSSSISPTTFYDNGNPREYRFLLDFDKQSIKSFVDDNEHDTRLVLRSSRHIITDNESTVVLHPLTKTFTEGYSENFILSDGASWIKNTPLTTWSNAGGDYTTSLEFSASLNNMTYSIPINHYITSNQYVDGLIMMSCGINGGHGHGHGDLESHGTGVVYTSYYTRHTKSNLHPYVISYVDDYNPVTGSAILFNSGSIPTEPFRMRSMQYNNAITVGNDFTCRITFEMLYSRMTFAYNTNVSYVPDLQYSVTDESTKSVLVDYNSKNKVYLNNGNYINFSTENFKSGVYSVKVKWVDGAKTWISQPILFFLYD